MSCSGGLAVVMFLASTTGKVVGKPFLKGWVDVCVEYFVYE